MKFKSLCGAAILAVIAFMPLGARGQDALTGDTKLACTAIMCLASPNRPAECTESIAKYFSISLKSFSKTAKARKNFLALCPEVDPSTIQRVVDDNPPSADPFIPDPLPTPPPVTPLTRAEIEARIAELIPIWKAQLVISNAAYKVVEDCVALNGRVQDGFCLAEVADFDLRRAPAGITRDEIYRLEGLLATFQ